MTMRDELYHYGTPRHSGRYPWGSGENPYQHEKDFLSQVRSLKSQGLSEVEIASYFGVNTADLRKFKSIARNEVRAAEVSMALRLKEKGYSNTAIADKLGIGESQVRNLLKASTQEKIEITKATTNVLKDAVNEHGYIDVGVGSELYLGISRTKLKTAIKELQDQGYTVYYIPVVQVGTGQKTTTMVLAGPDVTYSEVSQNREKIGLAGYYSEDGGRTYSSLKPVVSVNSKRVYIRYSEDGGSDRDGTIELRRGVEDLSLGKSSYAQVRIGVDGKSYMKGMAIYSDDIPDGYDIIFNTNKKRGTPAEDVFKNFKDDKFDPNNVFGAIVRQRTYLDADGNEKLSPLNIVREEGEWGSWSKNIASQMLSKQKPALAKRQLDLDYDIRKQEYDDIMALTNPSVKRRLLASFADDCDSAAVHLKAAAFPRQSTSVILPVPEMKENEVYAPNYKNGETVVLIRYPHGGIFEIPELKVNNTNKFAKKFMQNAKDAIGISPRVAEQLSGADFDGDTVIVIPNNSGEIRTSKALASLKNFDPKTAYPGYEGMKVMSKKTREVEMGKVSNLITDMTIKGADHDEIARAVRHSMVVIDAEKHKLNYKQSFKDNGIAALKKKYQGSDKAGASTLISRASSEERIPERTEGIFLTDPATGKKKKVYIDPDTGKKLYSETGSSYIISKTTKTGKESTKTIFRTQSSTKMYETEDARALSSGTMIEDIYADYANKMKALGNQARKDYISTKNRPYSSEANKTYSEEVSTLKAKLNTAKKNAPLERKAQILANSYISKAKKENPDMSKDEIKKIKGRSLTRARDAVGAGKQRIQITDKEWEAIQKGAISPTLLDDILSNTDLDKVKELATPRTSEGISPAKKSKALSMLSRGYTQAEVADSLGVSVSTLVKAIE